jgi:hypothetical protein
MSRAIAMSDGRPARAIIVIGIEIDDSPATT